VINALALFASHLFDMASVWKVVRELLKLSKQCLASLSSRLAPTFVRGNLVFLFAIYIFTCVTNILVLFPLLIKLAWRCTSLNNIVNATFFLVAIVYAY
jgi:hypothetical protein